MAKNVSDGSVSLLVHNKTFFVHLFQHSTCLNLMDTRPISSNWMVGRGSNADGHGQ